MKVIGLDGKTYSWNSGNVPDYDDSKPRSSLHLLARSVLKSIYPMDRILEEAVLPGSNGLTADFWLPLRRTIVEVHGEQHYKFIPFFHNTMLNFYHSKKNDKNKIEWCEKNNIYLVELPFNESEQQWRKRIEG
ncbi:hypothetical protein EBU24_00130 [bacterium]|nr:hypothetical protein [bacterium]